MVDVNCDGPSPIWKKNTPVVAYENVLKKINSVWCVKGLIVTPKIQWLLGKLGPGWA